MLLAANRFVHIPFSMLNYGPSILICSRDFYWKQMFNLVKCFFCFLFLFAIVIYILALVGVVFSNYLFAYAELSFYIWNKFHLIIYNVWLFSYIEFGSQRFCLGTLYVSSLGIFVRRISFFVMFLSLLISRWC